MKTRYSKPFETIQLKIPYKTGMSLYSGLTDVFEKKGLLKQRGNMLEYITPDGEIIKKYRKAWEKNDESCLDTVMDNFKLQVVEPVESTDDVEDDGDDEDIVIGNGEFDDETN